jgi:ketosteroid isomerase-like protein
MKKLILFVTIIFFAATSCQKKYDVEADRQALVKLTAEDWDANFLSGNTEANVNFYTEDAIRIWDGKVYAGKDEMRALFNTAQEEIIILKQENKVEDTWISGDLATVRGSFYGSYILKESGDTLNIKEAWVDVCERQEDDSWKMALTLTSRLQY